MIEELRRHFGYQFEDQLIQEINSVGVLKQLKEGSIIMDIGDSIRAMPLILDGAVKVLREDDEGDDLLLYFIEAGDTCAMTITCCMGETLSEIRAVAETDTTMIMVPVQMMSLWMHKYKSWQEFILKSYHERMHEMLEAVDSLAFMRMDERLFKYLKDKAMVNHNDMIHVTHKEIAHDLHTSRVVVSRLLKKLELEDKIELHRNNIKVLEL